MTSMALAIGNRGSGQARSLRLGALAGISAGLLLLLVVALPSSDRHDGTTTRELAAKQAAVSDWEAAVQPLISTGGQVVALGPLTGVPDLAQHRVPDKQIQTMAAGWIRQLSDLRAQIAAVPTPSSLRRAHDLLDTAMAGYLSASRDLATAAAVTGPRRDQLIADAASAGKTADRNFNLGLADIARLRAELDLPTDWSAS